MAMAVRKSSGAEECEYSSRKWCSTAQARREAELVGEARLLERVLEDRALALGAEGPRHRQLEEDAELHAAGAYFSIGRPAARQPAMSPDRCWTLRDAGILQRVARAASARGPRSQ